MQGKLKLRTHAVSGVPVLLLVAVFAVMCMLNMLLSVNAYTGIQADLDRDARIRVTAGYLTGRLRGADVSGGIRTESHPEWGELLHIREDDLLDTIYVWDGQLRELLWDPSEDTFRPDDGEVIVAAAAMTLERQDGMMTVTVTAPDQSVCTISCAIYSEEVAQ